MDNSFILFCNGISYLVGNKAKFNYLFKIFSVNNEKKFGC